MTLVEQAEQKWKEYTLAANHASDLEDEAQRTHTSREQAERAWQVADRLRAEHAAIVAQFEFGSDIE